MKHPTKPEDRYCVTRGRPYRTSEPTRALHDLTAQALAGGYELERLEVRRPTLEDVYLALVDDGAE